jgi:hypothetical protein
VARPAGPQCVIRRPRRPVTPSSSRPCARPRRWGRRPRGGDRAWRASVRPAGPPGRARRKSSAAARGGECRLGRARRLCSRRRGGWAFRAATPLRPPSAETGIAPFTRAGPRPYDARTAPSRRVPGDSLLRRGSAMGAGEIRLTVRVDDEGADPQELDALTAMLRNELLDLDVGAVEAPRAGPPPAGTRGGALAELGALAMNLASSELLAAVVSAAGGWLAGRHRRSVRLEVDGDVLELTGVPSAQQQRLVAAAPPRSACSPTSTRRRRPARDSPRRSRSTSKRHPPCTSMPLRSHPARSSRASQRPRPRSPYPRRRPRPTRPPQRRLNRPPRHRRARTPTGDPPRRRFRNHLTHP